MKLELNAIQQVLADAKRFEKQRPLQQPAMMEAAVPAKNLSGFFSPDYSDQSLSEDFAQLAVGVHRWSPGLDWMVNNGAFWERDDLLQRERLAMKVCNEGVEGLSDDAAGLARKICSSTTTVMSVEV